MKRNEMKLKVELEFANSIMCLSRRQFDEAKSSLLVAQDMLNKLLLLADDDEKRHLNMYVFNVERQLKYLTDKIANSATAERGARSSAQKSNNAQLGETTYSILPQHLKYTFDDVAGLDEVKQIVKDKVINPYFYPGLYQLFKKRHGGGILLYGLPGTGKTLIAQAIAKETNARFFAIKTSDVLSKWLGESCRNISEIFDQARKCNNAVIFFDEIDALTSGRDEGDSEAISRVVCELLAQMDGTQKGLSQNRLLIIGATNRPWKIDSAFLRPGRFDEQIYVPLPNSDARKTIIQNSIANVPGYANIDVDDIVAKTFNFSGADVNYLCEKAKELAIRRIITDKMKGREFLSQDFDEALSCVKSTVMFSDVCKMELWQKEKQGQKTFSNGQVDEQQAV